MNERETSGKLKDYQNNYNSYSNTHTYQLESLHPNFSHSSPNTSFNLDFAFNLIKNIASQRSQYKFNKI